MSPLIGVSGSTPSFFNAIFDGTQPPHDPDGFDWPEGPDLDVAGHGLVGGDSTVGSVSSSLPHLGLVDLDVGDDQSLDLKVFDLSVGLHVLEESEDDLAGFLRPSAFTISGFDRGYLCRSRLWT